MFTAKKLDRKMSDFMNCQLEKEKVGILIRQYGSPLYIFHVDEFKKNYRKLLDAVRSYYPKYNIAYSYKTNYTPRICKVVKELGGLAEVVSEMEFKLARRVGNDYKNIIYNGPVKGSGLFEQLVNGGIANIDSLDEMAAVIDFAYKNPDSCLRIAFRINIDIGQEFISRFGLDAYEDEADDHGSELSRAFEMAGKVANIRVVGLHCHIGRSRGIEAWKNRVRIMFTIIDRYFNKTPEFIDFGSGMNSKMEPVLAEQFGGHIPEFSEYAAVIGKAMMEKYGNLPETEQPMLYTEPGTTLVSGCMTFLATIETIKTVKKKTYVTFNCSGGNMGDICRLKNLPITVYHNDGELKQIDDATFAGYTCLEHDHIYEGFKGSIAVGDVVQFRNVGSYSNVFKPPFILPNCAMVELYNNGQTELIKREETNDDLFRTYVF